jgi:hypothetical protein
MNNSRRLTEFLTHGRTARQVADVLDAKFMDNPSWHLSRLVTVHPLGGCPPLRRWLTRRARPA